VDVVRISDRPHRKTSADEFFRAFAGHFNPKEWRYIHSTDDDDTRYTRFYRLWSLKESYIKAVGVGLGFELLRAEFVCLDSAREDRWELLLDGQPASAWQFVCSQIDADHLASVACGPLSAMWKPETSSLFPDAAALPSTVSDTSATENEEPAAWHEWRLPDLLQ
jgi:phosphopantetheinyl transferase